MFMQTTSRNLWIKVVSPLSCKPMSTLQVTLSVEQQKQHIIMEKVSKGRSIFLTLKESRDQSLFEPDKIYNNILHLIHFYQYSAIDPPSDLKGKYRDFFKNQKEDRALCQGQLYEDIIIDLVLTKTDGNMEQALKILQICQKLVEKEWIHANLLVVV
jgi:hypothetical protein